MIRRFRAAPLLLPALAGTALAQSPEGAADQAKPADRAPAQEGAAPAQGAPDQPQTVVTSGTVLSGLPGQLDSDGNYTVKKGDTLWDLSSQFLQNPWYWPKIWADNPTVENPHWIYPGNRLVIRRSGPGGLTGEVAPLNAEGNEDNSAYATAPKADLADFSVGNINGAGKFAEDSDLVSIGGSIPINLLSALPSVMRTRVTSVVTQHELADSGTLTHSFEEKAMLSRYDRVYATFDDLGKVRIGDVYDVFRTEDPVYHPVTKEKFGYRTRLLGTVKVVGKTPTEALCEVLAITDDIERGDHLAPAANLEKAIELTPNERDLTGVILTTDISGLVIPAQNVVVYIDKGAKDGVKDGNTFVVVQTGDGLDKLKLPSDLDKNDPLVRTPVASLVVFNVTDHAAAAMVVKSIRELNMGDRVEMHRSKMAGSGGEAP